MTEQQVTIEGSITPSAELPRGERRTVAYTDRIKRLVAKGYIVIVGEPVNVGGVDPTPAPLLVDEAIDPPPGPGIEVPADGTMSPTITGDGSGTKLPPVPGFDVPQHPDESAQPH